MENFKPSRVLNGVDAGHHFFSSLFKLSKGVLLFCGIITMISFWVGVALYFSDYFTISVFMLKVIRFFTWTLVVSIVFAAFLKYLGVWIWSREMTRLQKFLEKRFENETCG
jgi:hypothetical protein